jgi:hypothetical protein
MPDEKTIDGRTADPVLIEHMNGKNGQDSYLLRLFKPGSQNRFLLFRD